MLASRLRRASGDWDEWSFKSMPPRSNAEARARVAAAVPALGELLQRGIVGGKIDCHSDQLVAALAVLAGEAAALEAQHLARGRALGDGYHDRPLGRGNLDLGAEHRLLEGDRKGQADMLAVAGEEGMRRDLDRDDRVAAPARPLLALAGEPDLGPAVDALGELDVDRLAVGERHALRFQRHRVDERNLQPVCDVGAFLRRPSALAKPGDAAACARAAPAAAAEQALEQVAEVDANRATAGEIEIFEPRRARPWTAAGKAPAWKSAPAERHLGIAVLVDLAAVVARALVLVGQQVIGLGHFAEALGGLRIVRVAVGVELLGEASVRLLDVGVAGAARDSQS